MRSSLAEQLLEVRRNSPTAEIHRLLKETRCRSKKRRRKAREKLVEKYGIDPEGGKKDDNSRINTEMPLL